jgi:hypothetical protein
MSFGFLVINVYNHEEHYEMPYILVQLNSVYFVIFFRDKVLLDPNIFYHLRLVLPRALLPSGYST